MIEQQSGNPADIIKLEDIAPEQFGVFKKSGTTRARQLTEADFHSRGGIIQTLEGPATFKVGDYLAVGVKGEEYPIRAETMASTKKAIGESDEDGWTNYETTTTVRATRIDRPFGVKRVGTEDVNYGKPGDYLVDSGKRQFIVDAQIFAQTYESIPLETNQPTSQAPNASGKV